MQSRMTPRFEKYLVFELLFVPFDKNVDLLQDISTEPRDGVTMAELRNLMVACLYVAKCLNINYQETPVEV